MLRRLFTVFSALSLLLCVAVVVLWVWSYMRPYDELELSNDGRTVIMSVDGTAISSRSTAGANRPPSNVR